MIPPRAIEHPRWVPCFLFILACATSPLSDYGDPTERSETPILTRDTSPPSLSVDPLPETTSQAILILTGSADPDASVWIETATTPRIPVTVAEGRWSTPIALAIGPNTFTAVAQDPAGNETRLSLTMSRTRVITLRANLPTTTETTLRLDREQLLDEALMPRATRESIQLIEVPLRPVVKNALLDIAAQLETLPPGTPEYNLARLLNMTPDNADVTGSSVEDLITMAGGIGIPPERLLADVLLVEPTDRVVDFDRATDAMLTYLMGTHPAATLNAEGELVLRLTLNDVLNDMRTLEGRFGPSGSHPGFVPAGGMVESKVLLPGFAMQLPLTSNLQPFDGVDAVRDEKDIVYLLSTGSVLSFDFYSPNFTAVGIADEPTLDMQIAISESSSTFTAGAVQAARPDGAFYRGSSAVWDAQPWLLERLIAEMTYARYKAAFAPGYAHDFTYYVYPGCPTPPCPGNEVANIDWLKGWLTFTATGVPAVPPPQYVWDLLLEVAQLRLHDGGITSANCAFTLQRIPVGLTADALIEQTRPVLQAQEAELSEAIAGEAGLVAPRAEVYYRRDGGSDVLVNRLTGEEAIVHAGDHFDFLAADGTARRITVVSAHDAGIDITLEPAP